jgi:hypothetical protein
LPAPSQADWAVDVIVPAGHVASLHFVPAAYFWHAPAAQRPFVPQLAAPWSTQIAFGSTVPVGTFVHVPSLPGSAHDLHEALHVVEQQNPWAHTFDTHSAAAEHGAPFGFFPHELFVQTLGATQFVEAVQALKHFEPLHAYGRHARAAGATHWPVLLQVEAPVYTLLAHLSPAHTVPVAYLAQPPAPSQRPFVPHEAAP